MKKLNITYDTAEVKNGEEWYILNSGTLIKVY